MSSTFLIEKLKISFPGETFIARGGPRISSSNDQTYYGKSGTPSEVEQYRAEIRSLQLMSAAAPGLCPSVVSASHEGRPYLISDYLELSSLASSAGASTILARRLASELHGAKSNNGKFGFECPTFCGATKIDNGWYSTWADAYNAMIGGLLDKLEKQESYKKLCRTGREVQQRVIPHYLGDRLKGVEPVLCHGDLWSGNVGVDSEGNPAIFDPSSYYGHNESDLAIGRMFGGFSAVFYEQYHLIRPKSEPLEEYDQRVKLYQLFHYLNHTVLFGSGYANQAMNLATQLLKSLPL
ncbi:ketosamine-3-kinase [Rhizoctonia solani]|uniref:protein-ribulosamine 3-kinase n=1 Tax=Rhizoctonia solani TaxID=456999 RepID=A0A8H8P7B8_9AGAM|nr:ketosamine-3-kinase [Rhizoctonia solani]QRW24872.1 ketosamine-3-kinase [Rhizoctonia solani]